MSCIKFFVALIALLLISPFAGATNPYGFTYQGQLLTPAGAPSSDTVSITMQIYDPTASCLLYEQTQSGLNFFSSGGNFTLQVGSAPGDASRGTNDPSLNMVQVFNNQPGTVRAAGTPNCAPGYSPSVADTRRLRVTVTGPGGAEVLTPDQVISSAPFALSAEAVQGLGASELIKVKSDATTALSQANAENVFSNLNYPKLTSLLNGTSTQFQVATPTVPVSYNNQRLTNVANPASAQDASTKSYADGFVGGKVVDVSGVGAGVGGGKSLVWDQALNKWSAQAMAGAVSSLTAGSGLLGGVITTSGSLSVDVGTTANKIVQLNGSAQMPAVNGQNLTNINAAKLAGYDVSSMAPGTGQVLTWNSTLAKWEPSALGGAPVSSVAGRTGSVTLVASDVGGLGTAALKNYGTAATNLVELNTSGQLPAVDASLLTNVNSAWLQARKVSSLAPSGGQVLTWNASTTQWEPITPGGGGNISSLTGDVTATGPGTAAATIAANAVTSAKINNSGNTINRLLITDATTGATITYASCTIGEILHYTATGWACVAPSSTMTSIVGGVGLLGGTVTTNGTLSVDVGITANKIVQLNGAGQLPAVDGSQLVNANSQRLQSRAVSGAAPAGGQFLGWNNTLSLWEPTFPAAGGTVVSVGSGVGLIGGVITSSGSLSVDVGTTANKIVQLNGAGQLPAVDGSQLLNANSQKLQSRAVSAAAPAGGQVLAWNNTSSAWEPTSAAGGGSVISIIAGNGLVGGTITTSGSLDVDVGVAPNKIVQLTAAAQLPGVDGSLVSNINAVKLQGRNVSSTAPANAQVLIYNSTFATWEPKSGGTVQSVIAGLGLLGGTIQGSGTLGVDVGTTASKIIQLTVGAQLPPVDANLLTNVSAVKLQGRNVSPLAPSPGAVLSWNNSAAAWEPMSFTNQGIVNGGNNFGSSVTIGTVDNFSLNFMVGNLNAVNIDISGRVGMPTVASMGAILDLNATGPGKSSMIVPRDVTTNRPSAGVSGMLRYNTTTQLFEFYQNGVWTNYTTVSDSRLKANVQEIRNPLDLIAKMHPVFYDFDQSTERGRAFGTKHQVGFIAQELEQILPEVVDEGADSYRSVRYGQIVSVGIAATQELKSQVDRLRAENAELKERLIQQGRDLDAIKQKLGMP